MNNRLRFCHSLSVDPVQLFQRFALLFSKPINYQPGEIYLRALRLPVLLLVLIFLCSLMLSFKLVLSRVESLKLGSFIQIIFQRYH